MLELKFAKVRPEAPVFKFEEGSETFLTDFPTLMDPYDRKHVYIRDSKIPEVRGQDGLFARRRIEANQLVATYGGFKVYDEEKLYRWNMTLDEREDAHKNLMSFNEDFSLNLPPEYSDIRKYRATLGHKVHTYVGHHVRYLQ